MNESDKINQKFFAGIYFLIVFNLKYNQDFFFKTQLDEEKKINMNLFKKRIKKQEKQKPCQWYIYVLHIYMFLNT